MPRPAPRSTSMPDSASAVRLNNRLRRTVEAALGGLTLLSPDPAKRIAAAQSVFKSHDETVLPIDRRRARQGNQQGRQGRPLPRRAPPSCSSSPTPPRSKSSKPSPPSRRAAIRKRWRCLTGLGTDQPPLVAQAAAGAIASIQSNLAMWSMVQNAWYGLSLGSVLLLAAIGLAITFGVMGVINMAHGEMVMLGAYTTFVVQEMIRTRYPGLFDYSLLIAVPLAFLVAGAIGVLIERTHHPLPLRPAAGNAAGDLGPVAGAAAGGAHHVRPDQPRGRQSLLDERRVRARPDHHHL